MGRVRLVAAAALVAALAAGCGDAPTPKFAPPPSTEPAAPTTTAASDPLPPEMPELAKKHTVAGAKAFVQFVIATMNYSQQTLEPGPLRKVFSDGCYVCEAAPETVADVRKRHGTMNGGVISASDEVVEWLDVRRVHVARVRFTYGSTRQVVRIPGREAKIYPAGSARTSWILSPRDTGWLVIGWDAG